MASFLFEEYQRGECVMLHFNVILRQEGADRYAEIGVKR